MILVSPEGGTIAATSSRYKKRTSRQRLRRRVQLVAPGGKMLGLVEQSLQQQRHQQLPMQPGTTAVLPLLRQLPQVKDRFHALETKFDLPAAAVPVQHGRRVQHL